MHDLCPTDEALIDGILHARSDCAECVAWDGAAYIATLLSARSFPN
jgi:hypothetical protein